MTVAGGAVITPRMLDVLSSGGATNGEALAQGPYLKIRWAVGVSRGRWDRRRGVEEALWRRRWRCSDHYHKIATARGDRGEIPLVVVSARGFVTPLQEEFAGGAPCKEIDQEYYQPRESSIALGQIWWVVEAAQRVRKKGGRNRFSAKITKKRDFSM